MIWNRKDPYAWSRHFAWWPERVGSRYAWLERYEVRCLPPDDERFYWEVRLADGYTAKAYRVRGWVCVGWFDDEKPRATEANHA
jgi:hypothetical protein